MTGLVDSEHFLVTIICDIIINVNQKTQKPLLLLLLLIF